MRRERPSERQTPAISPTTTKIQLPKQDPFTGAPSSIIVHTRSSSSYDTILRRLLERQDNSCFLCSYSYLASRVSFRMKGFSLSVLLAVISSLGSPVSSFSLPTTTPACPGASSSSSARFSTAANNERSSSSTSTSNMPATPLWFQKEISITAPSRGCHLITNDILQAISTELRQVDIGLCHLFCQHTSASLTINENADPDVRRDMEVALNKIVPAEWNRDGSFRHTMEGDDDMPGHVKSSLMGVSLTVPIRQGRLALGTWQGIYLNGEIYVSHGVTL
jgi:secondary thiamine-phosphate synthase enzyme